MELYISKSALVAEIEKLRKSFKVISAASPSRDTTLENIAKATLCKQILSFIDSMQLEEIPPKFPIISSKEELKQKPFKVEKGKWYVYIKDYHDKNCTFTKGKKYKSDKDGFLVDDEDKDTFERKIWEEDACEYFRPIKCMYTEYNYPDEDRKFLCDGCEEEYEYAQKKEPISEGRDIFDNCLKSEEKFILPQKISGNIDCENCLYSSACALGDIQECIIEEPVSEDLEKALTEEWQGYVDRGAATVDALEDNTQELAFAKGFYRGAKWQKEQMMAKAIDGEIQFGTVKVQKEDIKEAVKSLREGEKVKVIVIKEN